MSDPRLPTLPAATLQEGFERATKVARVGVTLTRPLNHVRDTRRAAHDHDTVQLAASSQVIAIHAPDAHGGR